MGDYQYCFPAGLPDPDEGFESAADRELHEETVLDLVRAYPRSPGIFSYAGTTDVAIAPVFAEVADSPAAGATSRNHPKINQGSWGHIFY